MTLYKYIYGHAIDILESLHLKVTPPNEFNDPFELTPRSRFTITIEYMLNKVRNEPEHFRPAWEDLRHKNGYSGTYEQFLADLPNQIQGNFKEFKRRHKGQLTENDLKSVHEASNKLGILCLSKPNDSIPMWSYYANSHQGVAFGLNATHPCFERGQVGVFDAVTYRRSRLPIDQLLPPGSKQLFNQMTAIMFTKSKVWEHEDEYRRIYRLSDLAKKEEKKKKPLYFLNIDGDVIHEIIFGCCVDRMLEGAIRKEINRKKQTLGHIHLLRCKRHPKRFELQIVPA